MPSQTFQPPLNRTSTFLARGLRAALGAALLLTGGTMMLPGQVDAQSVPRILAQTNSGNGDVIVDTEPDTPTTPGDSGTGGETVYEPRFTCQMSQGRYTVMYLPESQPNQSYAWANPSAMGGGWTPERRCYEISRRLESYRPDGLLEMRTGIENGYNTICVTTEKVPSCRIVLTVPVGQDPQLTRDRVFENLTVADSGQVTQGVNTLTGRNRGTLGEVGDLLGVDLSGLEGRRSRARNRSNNIDLRPFLDKADGGTATRLQGGLSTGSSRRLRPNLFR